MTADPTPGADPRPEQPSGEAGPVDWLFTAATLVRSSLTIDDARAIVAEMASWPRPVTLARITQPGADPRLAERLTRAIAKAERCDIDDVMAPARLCGACSADLIYEARLARDAFALLPARTETTEADPHVVERLLASMPAKSGRLLVVEQWDDGDWSVSIPWMPGHIGVGDTLPEAYESAIDAAEAWSEGYRDHVAATTEAEALAALPDAYPWTIRHLRVYASATYRYEDYYEVTVEYGDTGPQAYYEPRTGTGFTLPDAINAALDGAAALAATEERCGVDVRLYDVAYGDQYDPCTKPKGHVGSHDPSDRGGDE